MSRTRAALPTFSLSHLRHGYVRILGEGKETQIFIVNIDCGWEEEYDRGQWRERVS